MSAPARIEAFVPYGRAGASTRVRVLDWLDHLGIPAAVHSYLGAANNQFRTLVSRPDRLVSEEVRLRFSRRPRLPVILSREASPLSCGSLERRLLTKAPHGTYDFDDALFHDRRGGLRSLASRPEKVRTAAEGADTVIAGNEYLADWAGRYNDNVEIIPSCVDPRQYRPKEDWEIASSPRIVWIGSPSTEKYLQLIAPALMEVSARRDARLTLISSGNLPVAELSGMTDRVEWDLTRVADVLEASDVAIAPAPDVPYARGKCAYKVLQYAAARLPTVSSPVGANVPASERCGGLLASTIDDWIDGLLLLLDSRTERERRGRAARSGVERHYSFQAWADTWLRAVAL